MDRGLTELEKLTKNLDDLKNQKEKNKLELLANEIELSNNFNDPLMIADLNFLKNTKKDVKKTLRERKKDILKFMALIIVVLGPLCCAIASAISLPYSIAVAIFIYAMLTPIFTVFEIINYFCYKNNLIKENIKTDEKIKSKTKSLEVKKSKKEEISKKIKELTETDFELQTKIETIENKINLINKKRSEVIEEFIKNSIELETLLNNCYDEQFNKDVKSSAPQKVLK